MRLPSAPALGAGEHAQEVLVDLAQHVTRGGRVNAAADGRHQIDQLAQFAVGQLRAGVTHVEDALALGVVGFDDGQRVVDALADVELLGGGAQGLPAGGLG